MNEIANNILTAIDIIVDKKISDIKFDRTVVVEIKQCVDSLIGKYRVQYQGEYFIARALTGVTFEPGDRARMLVPDNDLGQDKYLLGTIDTSTHYVEPASISDNYIKISKNIIQQQEEQNCDFETVVLYTNEAQATSPLHINIDEFESKIQNANALIVALSVKTQFPLVNADGQDIQYAGNYGLKFLLEYNDGSYKSYLFDSTNFTGSIYNLKSYTPQIFAFDNIHGESIKSLKSVEFYVDGFNGLHKIGHNAFSIKDIELYAAVSQRSLNQSVIAQGQSIKALDFELNELGETVSEQSTILEQTSKAIALKADKKTVDTLTDSVNKAEAQLAVQANEIASKVSLENFNALNQEVEYQNTIITQKADAIKLTALQKEVDTQGNEIAKHASELAVMPATILATVSNGSGDESFGWQLQSDNFSLQSSGTEVLRADKNGMQIKIADGHAGIANGQIRNSILNEGEKSPIAFYCGEHSATVFEQEVYTSHELADNIICYISQAQNSSFTFTLPDAYVADDKVTVDLQWLVIIDGDGVTRYSIVDNEHWITVNYVSCTKIANTASDYEIEVELSIDQNAQEMSYFDDLSQLRFNIQLAINASSYTYEVLSDGSIYARGLQITGSKFSIQNTSKDQLGDEWKSSFKWSDIQGDIPFHISIAHNNGSEAGLFAYQFQENDTQMYPTASVYAKDEGRETYLQVEPYGVQIGRANLLTGGNLHVYGNITATNFPQTNSDVRLKNTIAPLTSKYDMFIDELEPVTFKYNDGTSNRLHVGFIAQHVKEAMSKVGLSTEEFGGLCIEYPETDKEIWRLRYEEFIALNTYKIQQLNARVKTLEHSLAQLLGDANKGLDTQLQEEDM